MSKKLGDLQKHGDFSADRPITSSSHDRLGRGAFASGLAKRIQAWGGRDSLVIALCGEWGCGKTSLKNMVVERLSVETGPKVDLLEFTPWEISGHDSVAAFFFRELSVLLNSQSPKDVSTKARAAKLRAYAKLAALGDMRALRAFRYAMKWKAEGKKDGYYGDTWDDDSPLTENE